MVWDEEPIAQTLEDEEEILDGARIVTIEIEESVRIENYETLKQGGSNLVQGTEPAAFKAVIEAVHLGSNLDLSASPRIDTVAPNCAVCSGSTSGHGRGLIALASDRGRFDVKVTGHTMRLVWSPQ